MWKSPTCPNIYAKTENWVKWELWPGSETHVIGETPSIWENMDF